MLSIKVDGQCGKLVMVWTNTLSYWPSTSVYNTVGMSHCVAWASQRKRRLVLIFLALCCFIEN